MYYHFNLIDYLVFRIIASTFSWEAVSALATIFIGIFAYRISKQQFDLKKFAEVFLQARKLGDGYCWEFQLRNGSNHAVYITEIVPDTGAYKKYNLKISRNDRGYKLSLPPKEGIYYTLPVPPVNELNQYKNLDSSVCEIRLNIYFENNINKYKSHHVGWFQPPNDSENGLWSFQNLGAKKLE
ncbi:MAG: hypothetical protein A2915_00690 [Candidatus Yanofskybacteria bacterium RIFCSPLOWO2_01_FULL_41_34]|uniref:Uncharacterized protein n=1 Tax=Candidatus Yanofskybacteria bacterium RIFCSPHIGHO2_01_FULL_41_26 TaxID=1802661 RepID=A0A1F8EC73_9BACT|nr:MAG: hypothetical protein A2649_02720 [Candidatus Yanofskybacteria bacterium RIFCSPHIGHO2_01_FULL_41_26]OGN22414.1 MAG: hypothetical protein A2915_00690 [Candidatus Yanofskybacteria bacterium RIFCSPLOWO2_01_FULL_41_34]